MLTSNVFNYFTIKVCLLLLLLLFYLLLFDFFMSFFFFLLLFIDKTNFKQFCKNSNINTYFIAIVKRPLVLDHLNYKHVLYDNLCLSRCSLSAFEVCFKISKRHVLEQIECKKTRCINFIFLFWMNLNIFNPTQMDICMYIWNIQNQRGQVHFLVLPSLRWYFCSIDNNLFDALTNQVLDWKYK